MPRFHPTPSGRDTRFAVLAGISAAGFLLLAIALLKLQVVDHGEYQRLSQENRVRLEVQRAPRGAIFDRNGVLLADNRPSYNIVFKPLPAESTARVRAAVRADWLARVAWASARLRPPA